MTEMAQDFPTYAGDAVWPIYSVVDGAGAVVDLSTASEIVWTAESSRGDTVLEKRLSASQVIFVKIQPDGSTVDDDGTAGTFQVAINTGDTVALNGFYPYRAVVLDASGNQETVATGAMTVNAF